MLYLALYMIIFRRDFDVVFSDGVSSPLPLFRIMFPCMFYCHFPDKFLCTERASVWKRLYRAPLDWLEETTTGWANCTVVNSRFTASVFDRAFPRLRAPSVMYPVADFASFTSPDWTSKGKGPFVSLNRFERKKNVGLAIRALAVLKEEISELDMSSVRLVVAGSAKSFSTAQFSRAPLASLHN
jgi:glycosyltransferase involved in cell wall biosynthesis